MDFGHSSVMTSRTPVSVASSSLPYGTICSIFDGRVTETSISSIFIMSRVYCVSRRQCYKTGIVCFERMPLYSEIHTVSQLSFVKNVCIKLDTVGKRGAYSAHCNTKGSFLRRLLGLGHLGSAKYASAHFFMT